jgi:hypothetical protein
MQTWTQACHSQIASRFAGVAVLWRHSGNHHIGLDRDRSSLQFAGRRPTLKKLLACIDPMPPSESAIHLIC